MNALACLLAVAGVAACANFPSATQSHENLVLILNQDIAVESGRARVFLQDGQVTRTNELQTYQPSCDFEVVEVSQPGSEQVIRSDIFRVTRVHNSASTISSTRFEPNEQYADGREYLNTTYLTEFTLNSQSQSEVLRLNCKVWSIDPLQRYLSPAQIDQTLGSIATFKSQ